MDKYLFAEYLKSFIQDARDKYSVLVHFFRFPVEREFYSNEMIDISKVTDYLYVGSRIGKEHADELKVLNFNLIISMIGQMPPDEIFTLPPFQTLWIKTYDTFFTPITVKKLLIGVEAALPIIQNKGKLLVFCMQGKRRSVAMAAAILISMGHTGEQAIDLLTTARTVADPRRWYIRKQIHAFEKYWRKKGLLRKRK